MTNRLLLAGVAVLALAGIAIDFASAILSVLSDLALMGGAVFLAWKLDRARASEIKALKAEALDYREQLTLLRAATIMRSAA